MLFVHFFLALGTRHERSFCWKMGLSREGAIEISMNLRYHMYPPSAVIQIYLSPTANVQVASFQGLSAYLSLELAVWRSIATQRSPSVGCESSKLTIGGLRPPIVLSSGLLATLAIPM